MGRIFLLDIREFLTYARARVRESVTCVVAGSCLDRATRCAHGDRARCPVPVPGFLPAFLARLYDPYPGR